PCAASDPLPPGGEGGPPQAFSPAGQPTGPVRGSLVCARPFAAHEPAAHLEMEARILWTSTCVDSSRAIMRSRLYAPTSRRPTLARAGHASSPAWFTSRAVA